MLILVLAVVALFSVCGCITSPLVDTRGMNIRAGDPGPPPADASEREKMLYDDNQRLRKKIGEQNDEIKKLKKDVERLQKDLKKARGE
jgi:HAMP domain-containing protein